MKKSTLILLFCLIVGLCNAQTKPNWLQVSGAPIFDVKHYGAKGDGVTNDTAAIQAAISAAASANGGCLLFPPGTYNTGALLITGSNIGFYGYGATLSFLSGYDGLSNNAGSAGPYHDVERIHIEGLTFEGNHKVRHCVAFRGEAATGISAKKISIVNCTIKDPLFDGIHFFAGFPTDIPPGFAFSAAVPYRGEKNLMDQFYWWCRDIYISNVDISKDLTGTHVTARCGVNLESAGDAVVQNSVIRGFNRAVHCENAINISIDKNYFTNNIAEVSGEPSYSADIVLSKAAPVFITNNLCETSSTLATRSIYLISAPTESFISNNVLTVAPGGLACIFCDYNIGNHPAYISEQHYMTVQGNTLNWGYGVLLNDVVSTGSLPLVNIINNELNYSQGIYVAKGLSGNTSGNRITTSGAIELSQCNNFVVAGNNFVNHPSYALRFSACSDVSVSANNFYTGTASDTISFGDFNKDISVSNNRIVGFKDVGIEFENLFDPALATGTVMANNLLLFNAADTPTASAGIRAVDPSHITLLNNVIRARTAP